MLLSPKVMSPGIAAGQFGFGVMGPAQTMIEVEVCTNLMNPAWSPVATNSLTDGSSYFSDPAWRNYPARFYRLRSP